MPLPRARVTLPDGQELDVEVTGRERTGGTWWYLLLLTLPGPQVVEFRAAYPTVRPIPGVSYADLPGGPAEPARLLVDSLPRPDRPLPLVHRTDCWVASSSGRPVSQAEADELVAAGARLCDVCLPGRAETWDGRS
jgi:hypothetical protein